MTGHLHAGCARASFERVTSERHTAARGSGSFSPPGTTRKYERSRPFVVRHLALDIELHFEQKAVSGSATLRFERQAPSGTTLDLDAVGFQVRDVSLAVPGKPSRTLSLGDGYEYDGDTLSILVPEGIDAAEVTIDYRAVPAVGLYFLAPDDKVPARPLQVWSQCQDEDARHWFPCQDKPHVKMTSEMRVTVPSTMTVLSGGRLVESRPLDAKSGGQSKTLYHYALDFPSPAYLTTLVAGTFDEWQEEVTLPSGRVIPLRYLVPPGKRADGKRAFDGTGHMIELFSKVTGVEYPWDRYSQVVVADFIFGGMENTTATTMYEHILLDKRAALDIDSHDLVAHELAHQWFGDLVTCRDWSHAWLNEGFATYFELVEKEDRLGLDEYEEGVAVDLDAYLGEAHGSYQRPIVCRDYEEPIDLFDRHLYQKGGVVLHLLRKSLGDAAFWGGIRAYLERFRGGIVETTNLVRALEESSGLSLEKVFDHWVYRAGHPELSIRLTYEKGHLTVDLEQTQAGKHDSATVFEIPLVVDVTVDGKTTRHRRDITEKKGSLVIAVPKRPSLVVFDPDFLVPAPIKLSGPQDLLRGMLTGAPRARSRKLAAGALARRPDPENIEALGESLVRRKESWIVRGAAAEALGKLKGDRSLELLLAGASDGEPRVRRAVASALGQFEAEKAGQALLDLLDDESYLVSAAAARSLGRRHPVLAKERLAKLLSRSSWADVVRAGALDGLASTGDEAVTEHLIEWSRYGKPLRARRTAISALPRISESQKVRKHLEDLLSDRDPHTRAAVVSALQSLKDTRATGAISALLDSELDGRVRRRAKSALSALGKAGSPGLEEARQKAQKLEDEIAELKARLSKLEQHKAPSKGKAAPPEKATKKTAKKASAKTSKKTRKKR